jgi:hypothetical protein
MMTKWAILYLSDDDGVDGYDEEFNFLGLALEMDVP